MFQVVDFVVDIKHLELIIIYVWHKKEWSISMAQTRMQRNGKIICCSDVAKSESLNKIKNERILVKKDKKISRYIVSC